MKNAHTYKAALYEDSSVRSGFWIGRATDKQISDRVTQISNYWIADFLESDFRTTAAAGTRRLALALRNAVRNSDDVRIKREIAAAVTIASNLGGQRITVRNFVDRFALSEEAAAAISGEIGNSNLLNETFQFDRDEFVNQISIRTVELDSGVQLTADASVFNDVFSQRTVDGQPGVVRFTTQGRIVDEKVGKGR